MQIVNPETGKIMCEGSLAAILIWLAHTFPQHAEALPKHAPTTDRDWNKVRRIAEAFAAAKGYDLYI